MKVNSRSVVAAALLSAGITHGAPTSFCASVGDVCFGIAVPSSSASSGSGNIYFQISAPTSYQWVALGTGSGMFGSNMFVLYQDGAGNVTISPRAGTFHTPPSEDTSSTGAKLTLLAGSGVINGKMIANVQCSNCEAWSSGQTLSLTSSGSGWISAWRQGSSLATKDKNAALVQHDDTDQFTVNLNEATVSSDSNPFVSAQTGNGTSADPDTTPSTGSGVVILAKPSNTVLVAHGVIMALVMAILYPLGSLLMPLLGKWWLHGAWQVVAFCLMWAGFGLGVQAAMDRNELFDQAHTRLGTVVVCLMVIQPALGFLHHRNYVATQSRGIISYAHIWWGRALMVLGIVNGGLGLQLSNERNSLIIAYSVVAGVIFLAYFVVKGWSTLRKRKGPVGGPGKETGRPL
ncbi:hypothetical protein B0T24DRAFT_645424 [Lasiosphaeria ovina]|uniref:DOMON domain-containing protein n=1 Tax=Lasiosphaeria ovina TaxID=92902 RepID=A0AAE0NJW9_9PEZI|nr:hypothetical protein B0T24DRAFT_645424 [Lasiosphaeria ovina]